MPNTKNIVFNSENITNKKTKQEILEFIDKIIGKAIRNGYKYHGNSYKELYTKQQKKKLFSKEIEDYQQNNNLQKGNIDDHIDDAVVNDITNRLIKFIQQYKENIEIELINPDDKEAYGKIIAQNAVKNIKIHLIQSDHASIKMIIKTNNKIHEVEICNCSYDETPTYYECGLPKETRIFTKETITNDYGSIRHENVLYQNTIKKQMFENYDSIQDIILGLEYKSTEEYNEYKQDNVTMNFFHNNNDKITKIQLSRDYWIKYDNYQEITEFFLDKGNISKINKYKKTNDEITENIHNKKTDENTIKNEFQQAFNTKDVAIQNILAELNSKQKACIDNIKQQLYNNGTKKEIKLEDENEANKNNDGQKGLCSCKNNCDCGLSKLFDICR